MNWIDKASKNEETGSGKALLYPSILLPFFYLFLFVCLLVNRITKKKKKMLRTHLNTGISFF